MKPVNLLSIIEAKNDLSEELFKEYLELFGIIFRKKEFEDISNFINALKDAETKVSILNYYYIGYKINQISKEFDLLRFGNNYIVNIELKSKSTDEAIKQQLIENKYYLNVVDKPIYSFTYNSEKNKLYCLDCYDELIESNFNDLENILKNQKIMEIKDLHEIFNPTYFLVSPVNTTDKFIEGKYFLTNHQIEIKNKILDAKKVASNKYSFIEGAAGTGKTLFIYDIAKEYIDNSKKVLMIHCGILNEGHQQLISKYNWEIKPIKTIYTHDIADYDLVVFDETQRIWARNREILMNKIKSSNAQFIFAYDREQYLADFEKNSNTVEYIESQIAPNHFKLTEKIRTNKEIAGFIKNLFDLSKVNNKINYSNVTVKYFSGYDQARQYMNEMSMDGWEIINFTPSEYATYAYTKFSCQTHRNAHNVVGQEFDNVVAVIDSYFYYKEELDIESGKMTRKLAIHNCISKGYYYNPVKMLFQIMTRTRKKLTLIVIDNEAVLKECIKIVS